MFDPELSPDQQQEKYLEDSQDNGILEHTGSLIQQNKDKDKEEQEEKAKLEAEDNEIGELETHL